VLGKPSLTTSTDLPSSADLLAVANRPRSSLPSSERSLPGWDRGCIPLLSPRTAGFHSQQTPDPGIHVEGQAGRNVLHRDSSGWGYPGERSSPGRNVQWFDNGPKDSPFFYFAPYRKKVSATFDLSTRSRQEYILEYDQPYIADSPWRVRAYEAYLAEKFADYFGIGERMLGRLSFPGTPGVTYGRTNEYFDARREDRDGKAWARFNYFDKRQITFVADLEHDYFGGLLRPLVGVQVSHVDVDDYTGVQVDGNVNQETLLRQDFREGRIRGFDGGWLNLARVGLTCYSRDYEPNPSSGLLGQVLWKVQPDGSGRVPATATSPRNSRATVVSSPV